MDTIHHMQMFLHHENRRNTQGKDAKNNIGFGLQRSSPFRKKLGVV